MKLFLCGGHGQFRPELALMYFAALDAGRLARLTLVPLRMRRFRLQRASSEEAGWLAATLGRESRMPLEPLPDGRLRVR